MQSSDLGSGRDWHGAKEGRRASNRMMLGTRETWHPFSSCGKGVGVDNCTRKAAKRGRHAGHIPLIKYWTFFSHMHSIPHLTFLGKKQGKMFLVLTAPFLPAAVLQ